MKRGQKITIILCILGFHRDWPITAIMAMTCAGKFTN